MCQNDLPRENYLCYQMFIRSLVLNYLACSRCISLFLPAKLKSLSALCLPLDEI